MAGFTTVRDVGTFRAFVDVALRDAIRDGTVVGRGWRWPAPTSPFPGRRGRHRRGPRRRAAPRPPLGEASSPAEVRQRVRAILYGGADFIKVIATGAVLALGTRPGAPSCRRRSWRRRSRRRPPTAPWPPTPTARASSPPPWPAPLHRARLAAGRRGGRPAGRAGHLPGRRHLQRRLHRLRGPGRAGRPRPWERGHHPGPARRLRHGGQGRRADRLRHRQRRLPARLERQAAALHGPPRDDPDGRPPVGHRGRRRAARLAGPGRRLVPGRLADVIAARRPARRPGAAGRRPS